MYYFMTLSSLRDQILFYTLANKTEGKKQYLFLLELIVVTGTYVISLLLWKVLVDTELSIGNDFLVLGILNLISWSIFYKFTIIAKIPRTRKYFQILFQFVRIAFIALILLIFLRLLFGLNSVSLVFIILHSGLNLFTIFLTRILSYAVFKNYRVNGKDLHKVIVVADWYSDMFIEKIINEKDWGFMISKIITSSNLIRAKYKGLLEILPENTDIKKIIDNEIVDEVIYCKGVFEKGEIRELIDICNEVGVIFRLQSDLSPLKDLQLELKTLGNPNQLSLVDVPSNNISLLFKQISDIYFSLTMLVLLSPLFLIIGIIIKFDSKGPVFFSQERVGLRGRRFMLYKFRTMIVHAEKLLDKLKDKNQADGPVFKIKSDPRITRMGSYLRKTGIDELPQLYNVLKGEMSLIGPRPSLPAEVAKYERWQLRRLSVKPGITCTWQILPDRNDVKFEKWMKLDLQYIDNWNLLKDMNLFIRTIATFFSAKGH